MSTTTIAPDLHPVLSLEGVDKSFGAVAALTDIQLEVSSGEVVAVVGDNGRTSERQSPPLDRSSITTAGTRTAAAVDTSRSRVQASRLIAHRRAVTSGRGHPEESADDMSDRGSARFPAGWYQAPGESSLDRYWDGAGWTARTRPRPPAGLQPASARLIEHDDGRHPLAWIFAALGTALLIVAVFSWREHADVPAGLLGTAGGLVLTVSTALLQADLPPRALAVVRMAVGAAFLVAGVVAAVTITGLAWCTASSGLVLVATSAVRLWRGRQRQARLSTTAGSGTDRRAAKQPLLLPDRRAAAAEQDRATHRPR